MTSCSVSPKHVSVPNERGVYQPQTVPLPVRLASSSSASVASDDHRLRPSSSVPPVDQKCKTRQGLNKTHLLLKQASPALVQSSPLSFHSSSSTSKTMTIMAPSEVSFGRQRRTHSESRRDRLPDVTHYPLFPRGETAPARLDPRCSLVFCTSGLRENGVALFILDH